MEDLKRLDIIYDSICNTNKRYLGADQLFLSMIHSISRIHSYAKILRIDKLLSNNPKKEYSFYINQYKRKNRYRTYSPPLSSKYPVDINEKLENYNPSNDFFGNQEKKYELICVDIQQLRSEFQNVYGLPECFVDDEICLSWFQDFSKHFSQFSATKKSYPDNENVFGEFLNGLIENNLEDRGRMIIYDSLSHFSGNLIYKEGENLIPADMGHEFRIKNSYRLEVCFNLKNKLKQGPYEDIHEDESTIIVLTKKNAPKMLLENRFELTSNYVFSSFDYWYETKEMWMENKFVKGEEPKPNSEVLLKGSVFPNKTFIWHPESLLEFDFHPELPSAVLPEKPYNEEARPWPKKTELFNDKCAILKPVIISLIQQKEQLYPGQTFKNHLFSNFTFGYDFYEVYNYKEIISKNCILQRFEEFKKNQKQVKYSDLQIMLFVVEDELQAQAVYGNQFSDWVSFDTSAADVISIYDGDMTRSVKYQNIFYDSYATDFSFDTAVLDYTKPGYNLEEETMFDLLIKFQSQGGNKFLFLFLPPTFLEPKNFLSIKNDFSEFVSHMIIGKDFCFLGFSTEPKDNFLYYAPDELNNKTAQLLSVKLKSQTSRVKNSKLSNVNWASIDSKSNQEVRAEESIEILKRVDKNITEGFKKTQEMIGALGNQVLAIKNSNNKGDEEKIKEIEGVVQKSIEKTAEDIISKKEEAIKEWIHDLDFIKKPESLIFMTQAEYLLEVLSESKDLSPFIIQYSRAIENELLLKVFLPYHNHFFETGKDIEKMTQVLENIAPPLNSKSKRKVAFELKPFKSHLSKKENDKYTLGTMAAILKHMSEKKYSYTHTELLRDFEAYTNEKIVFSKNEKNFMENLESLNSDYRVKAAHPNLISFEKAREFHEMIKKTINQLIKFFKNK